MTGKQQARIIVRDRRLVSLLGLRRGKAQGQVRSRSEKQSENKSWKVCMRAMLLWQGVKGVHLCIHILGRSVVLMQRWKFPLQRNKVAQMSNVKKCANTSQLYKPDKNYIRYTLYTTREIIIFMVTIVFIKSYPHCTKCQVITYFRCHSKYFITQFPEPVE